MFFFFNLQNGTAQKISKGKRLVPLGEYPILYHHVPTKKSLIKGNIRRNIETYTCGFAQIPGTTWRSIPCFVLEHMSSLYTNTWICLRCGWKQGKKRHLRKQILAYTLNKKLVDPTDLTVLSWCSTWGKPRNQKKNTLGMQFWATTCGKTGRTPVTDSANPSIMFHFFPTITEVDRYQLNFF